MALADVVIYLTTYCPYCIRAKALLAKKNVAFREINVEDRPDLRSWLAKKSGQRTVPQIFVNGRPLGGYTELASLEQRGQLDPLLASARTEADPTVEL